VPLTVSGGPLAASLWAGSRSPPGSAEYGSAWRTRILTRCR